MQLTIYTADNANLNKVALFESDDEVCLYAFVTMFLVTVHKDVHRYTLSRKGDDISLKICVPDGLNREWFDAAMKVAALESYEDMD